MSSLNPRDMGRIREEPFEEYYAKDPQRAGKGFNTFGYMDSIYSEQVFRPVTHYGSNYKSPSMNAIASEGSFSKLAPELLNMVNEYHEKDLARRHIDDIYSFERFRKGRIFEALPEKYRKFGERKEFDEGIPGYWIPTRTHIRNFGGGIRRREGL